MRRVNEDRADVVQGDCDARVRAKSAKEACATGAEAGLTEAAQDGRAHLLELVE